VKIIRQEDLVKTQVSHNANIGKTVFIQPGEIPNIVYFSQATFPPGEVALEHSHVDMTEVFYIQFGEGAMRVDDKVLPLNTGDCITVAPGEKHELVNMGVDDMIVTYFGVKT
jgi:mannose-6-phosphate isomerase-like protein (cupin superfamily)